MDKNVSLMIKPNTLKSYSIMKYFLSFIFSIFVISNSYSQEILENRTSLNTNKIIGNWGFDFIDYQDGTRMTDDYVQRMTATMLIFRKMGTLSLIHHANVTPASYAIQNDFLSINQELYKIEKLTPQELIFTEYDIRQPKQSYQTKRYHYLSTKESSEQFYLRKFVKPNIRIKAKGDTAYAFCEDFYPHYIIKRFDGRTELKEFNNIFRTSYRDIDQKFNFPENKKGRFSLFFEISKEGKIVEPFVKESSDSTYNNQLLEALASTNDSWTAAEYKFKPIAVQINYIFEYDVNSQQIDNNPFDPEMYEYYLRRGDRLFAEKNYEKAVKNYTKCILMTDDAVEPLYKRADCYFTVNAIKNACSDWNYLIKKGQKRAEDLYLTHCMK
jgi:tetratricopeptide (TPR) repeat protein